MAFIGNIGGWKSLLGGSAGALSFGLADLNASQPQGAASALTSFLGDQLEGLQRGIGDRRLVETLDGLRTMRPQVFDALDAKVSFPNIDIAVDAQTAPQLESVASQLTRLKDEITVAQHAANGGDAGARIRLAQLIEQRNRLGVQYFQLQRTGSGNALTQLTQQLESRYPAAQGYQQLLQPGTDVVAMIRQANPKQREQLAAQLAVARGVLAARLDHTAAQIQELEYLISTGAKTPEQEARLEQLVREHEEASEQLDRLTTADAATGSSLTRHPGLANAVGDGLRAAVVGRRQEAALSVDPTRDELLDAARRILGEKRNERATDRRQYGELVRGYVELTGRTPGGRQLTLEQFDALAPTEREAEVEASLELDRKGNAAALAGDFSYYDGQLDLLLQAAQSYEEWRAQEDRIVERRLEDRRAEERLLNKRQAEEQQVQAWISERRAWRQEEFARFLQGLEAQG